MGYTNEFIQLIKSTQKEEFIGFGNPNSRILFVGRECSLNLSGERDRFIFDRSNRRNWDHWNRNINDSSITPESIPVWRDSNGFNPLFPYKGDSLPSGNKGNCFSYKRE